MFAQRTTSNRPSKPPVQRFWAMVNKDGPVPEYRPELGPCWLWTASLRWGYGTIRVGKDKIRAHRIAYLLLVGPIPEGLELDHLCRVKHCVNPAHLEAVTHAENVRRGPVSSGGTRTHCARGHRLAGDNVYVRPSGGRQCRVCRAIQRRSHVERTGR